MYLIPDFVVLKLFAGFVKIAKFNTFKVINITHIILDIVFY